MTRDESEALAAFVNRSSERYTATALPKGGGTAVAEAAGTVAGEGVPREHYCVVLMDREVGGNPIPVGDAAEHLRLLERDREKRGAVPGPGPARAASAAAAAPEVCTLLRRWLGDGAVPPPQSSHGHQGPAAEGVAGDS
jgi:hypothetical protein